MSRVIAAVAATYEEDGLVKRAKRGDEVDLPAPEEKRLDELKALVPKHTTLDEHLAEAFNNYRAQRGDTEAAAALANARSGGIVDLSAPEANDANSIAAYLRDEKPTVEQTIALAEGDPAKAKVVLQAENLVTGGEARIGVSNALEKIVEG